MWLRTALLSALGVGFLAAVLLAEGMAPRELPLWLALGLALGLAAQRYARPDPRSRAVKISAVAIVEDTVLAVKREGQSPRAYRLRDGGELATSGVRVVEPEPGHEVDLVTRATYGDIARLWLEGDRRRTLHGLQPQPAAPLEVVRGELVTTKHILAAPTEPLPILLFHIPSLDEPVAELLTLVALDGAVRWQIAFPAAMIRRARQLFVTADQLVFVLGRTPGIYGYGTETSRRHGDEPPEAVAIDRASGAVTWRAKI